MNLDRTAQLGDRAVIGAVRRALDPAPVQDRKEDAPCDRRERRLDVALEFVVAALERVEVVTEREPPRSRRR
jgi:hypothetical protein